jgi:ABC-type sugar transport system ATPase subunit
MSAIPISAAMLVAQQYGFSTPFAESPGWQARYGDQEVSQFRSAEMIAEKWDLSREEMEEFALTSHTRARAAIDEGIAKLRIKLGRPEDPVATLSGGNQQKVVIAKWLMVHPDLILLNDPTRGIDVGTKQELYRLMRELADEGKAILFYSTDYAELIGCCDRVSVMYDGAVLTELEGEAITEEAIVAASLNLEPAA